MNDDERFGMILARDGGPGGRWCYGVMTTGVFCRPGCASRPPLRRNVRFYEDAAGAAADGLRACKRCRPEAAQDPLRARITALCALIDAAETSPKLADLARAAGVSAAHLQRQFTRIVGVSPRKYAAGRRRARFRAALRTSGSVTGAIYEAGYGASSHAYAESALGMAPAVYAGGADAATLHFACCASALGRVLVAATSRGVCAVRIGDDDTVLEAELRAEFPRATLVRGDEVLASATSQLVTYLAGSGPWPQLPLDLRGTAFQQRVWDALRTIASGDTRRYGELARALGDPAAARAVGAACAANPAAILVPCHRVLPKAGGDGGFRWGTARKRALLALERVQPPRTRP